MSETFMSISQAPVGKSRCRFIDILSIGWSRCLRRIKVLGRPVGMSRQADSRAQSGPPRRGSALQRQGRGQGEEEDDALPVAGRWLLTA